MANIIPSLEHSLWHQQVASQVSVCPICYVQVNWDPIYAYRCPEHGMVMPVLGYAPSGCPFPHEG